MRRPMLLIGSLLVALLLAAVVGWTAPPKAGGTLRITLPGDMTFFNANQGPAPVRNLLGLEQSLSSLSLRPTRTQDHPGLATSWDVLDEGGRMCSIWCKACAFTMAPRLMQRQRNGI